MGKITFFKSGLNRGTESGRAAGTLLFLIAALMTAAVVFGTAAAVRFLHRLSQDLPTVSQMQNIEQSLSSKVLDKDGKIVHRFSVEHRIWVPLAKIPADLQNAVVAIEDRRFYGHWGIDIRRLVRAALIDISSGEYAQGASTITQQLARNLYLTLKPSMIRKVREALTAMQLESCYTKKEILELYLNQVYLGAGAWGVEAASERYLSRHAEGLDLNECATLAGIIQQPERYRLDRTENHRRAAARRNAVLAAMVSVGSLESAAAAAVMALPVPFRPFEPATGVGDYFLEMVRKYTADKYGDEELYNGGLTIYTTMDRTGQAAAEDAAAREIDTLQRRLNRIFTDSTKAYRKYKVSRDTFLAHFDSLYPLRAGEFQKLPDSFRLRRAQIAVFAIDAASGAIRTVIGGRDFKESKFNRVTQALRQPGSAFKPFVYTAAMEHGFTPATQVLDQPITLQTPQGEWRPENYDHAFHGPTTVRRALALSVNLVAIQVCMKVGPHVVVDYVRRMGFTHEIQKIPSIAVGSCEVTPLEMTCAYQIFANKGVASAPYCVEKIIDRNGRVLEQHAPKEREVLSPQTAYLMCSLLQTVVCCGTASTIPGLGFTRPAAGKTGTTNNYSDAWFVGFTPQVVCCVWAGVDERRSIGAGVTGSEAAVPVWAPVMIALHAGLPVRDFEVPDGIKTEKLCDQSHLIATRWCPKVKPERFFTESVIDTCALHGPARAPAKPSQDDFYGTAGRGSGKQSSKKNKLMF